MRQFTPENMPGEGWYWGLVDPLSTRSIRDTFQFHPDILTDSLKIKLTSQSGSYDASVSNYHNVAFLINRDTVAHFITDTSGYFINNINVPFRQLIKGNNFFEFYSIGGKNANGNLSYDEVWLDYLELSGESNAIYNNFNNYYEVDKLIANSDFQVSGFKTNNIVVIDSAQNAIYFPNSSPILSFEASTKNNIKAFTTVSLNDSLIENSNSRGFHIFTIDILNPKIKTYKFYPESYDVLQYLNDQSDNKLIVFVYNSNAQFPQNLKTKLAGFGAKKSSTIIDGSSSYIFAFSKSGNISYGESLENSNYAKLSYIADNANSDYLQAHVKLEKGQSNNLTFAETNNFQPVTLYSVNKTDLSSVSNSADYIVIYHKDFQQTAEELIKLRKTTHPNVKSMMIDADDIYKEFGNGSKSPHAIKNFFKYAYSNWKSPSCDYVTLLGDASTDPKMILSISKYKDFIPSYGNPVSDCWYAMLYDSYYYPQLSISRIPIKNQSGRY